MAKMIATIYCPVGHVEQEENKPIKVVLEDQWAEVAKKINDAIAAGQAFICPDRVPRPVDPKVNEKYLDTLSHVLEVQSRGDLFLIPVQEQPTQKGENDDKTT